MKKSEEATRHNMAFLQCVCQSYLRTNTDSFSWPGHLDSDGLWTAIRDHKLQMVLYEVIKSGKVKLPEHLSAKLEKRARRRSFQKLFCIQELKTIQEAHASKGIFIIPYKGLAIGEMFYGNINQRDFVDIDLAIEEKHIIESAKLMRSLGYEELKGESNFVNVEQSRAYHIDYAWLKQSPNGNFACLAEIHWQATNSALYSPVKFKDLSRISQPRKILSEEFRLFTKVENAYLMILHHGIVDGWFQLRHLVDLVRMMRALDREELSALIIRLEETGMLKAFYYGVQLSKDILEVQLENIVVPALPMFKRYLNAVRSGRLQGKWSVNKRKFFYYLLLHDSQGDRAKSIYRFMRYSFKEIKFKS